MTTALIVMLVDTFLVAIAALMNSRKLVFVSGSGADGAALAADAAVILDEHRRDLRSAVKVYRWIGVAMTVALAITAGAALWQLIATGMSAVFAGLAIYTGVLTYLVTVVYKRVDMYEQMYRDALPPRQS
jgi:hypothetical protein